MARALRIEFKGAVYHVTSRGNDRKNIFFSNTDYRKFLEYLAEAKKKFNIIVHSYVSDTLSPCLKRGIMLFYPQ